MTEAAGKIEETDSGFMKYLTSICYAAYAFLPMTLFMCCLYIVAVSRESLGALTIIMVMMLNPVIAFPFGKFTRLVWILCRKSLGQFGFKHDSNFGHFCTRFFVFSFNVYLTLIAGIVFILFYELIDFRLKSSFKLVSRFDFKNTIFDQCTCPKPDSASHCSNVDMNFQNLLIYLPSEYLLTAFLICSFLLHFLHSCLFSLPPPIPMLNFVMGTTNAEVINEEFEMKPLQDTSSSSNPKCKENAKIVEENKSSMEIQEKLEIKDQVEQLMKRNGEGKYDDKTIMEEEDVDGKEVSEEAKGERGTKAKDKGCNRDQDKEGVKGKEEGHDVDDNTIMEEDVGKEFAAEAKVDQRTKEMVEGQDGDQDGKECEEDDEANEPKTKNWQPEDDGGFQRKEDFADVDEGNEKDAKFNGDRDIEGIKEEICGNEPQEVRNQDGQFVCPEDDDKTITKMDKFCTLFCLVFLVVIGFFPKTYDVQFEKSSITGTNVQDLFFQQAIKLQLSIT